MMTIVRRIIGALLVVGGCSVTETYWAPMSPREAGAKCVVLVFGDGDGASFAWVDGLQPDGALAERVLFEGTPWAEDRPESPRARALYYKESPAELGLTEGSFARRSTAQSCLLEHPITAYEATPSHGTPTTWVSGSVELSSAEHDLLLGDAACVLPNYCHRLEAIEVELPTQDVVEAIIPVSDDEVLASTRYGQQVYRVTRSSVVTSTIHSGLPAIGWARTPDGELWLGGPNGLVVHGPTNGPFISTPIPDLARFVVGALGVEAETGAILALSVYEPMPGKTTVHRLEAGQWRLLHEGPVADSNTTSARLVEYGPQRWMASYRDQTLLTIDGDVVTRRSPALDMVLGYGSLLNGLASLDRGEVYLGSSSGRLYLDRTGRGEADLVTRVAFPAAILSVVPWDDRLFLGGAEGLLLEYHPLGRSCDYPSRLRTDVGVMVRVGDALVASGGRISSDDQAVITWITPR